MSIKAIKILFIEELEEHIENALDRGSIELDEVAIPEDLRVSE